MILDEEMYSVHLCNAHNCSDICSNDKQQLREQNTKDAIEIINIPYKTWLENIKREISNFGTLLDKKNSFVQYLDVLNSATNSSDFFKKISKMYTLEGFLFRKLNEYLRTFDKVGLENLKYFYNSLLASFEYFSKVEPPKGINLEEDLIIYRGSKILVAKSFS